MSVTLEGLHTRLTRLEQEMESLRQAIGQRPGIATPAERGIRMREAARRTKPQQRMDAATRFAEMGTVVDPVQPAKLREMMAADGVRPEDNLLSRGIAEMRDE